MREKINQGLARTLVRIRGMIIAEIGHTVLHKECAGVVTEAGVERRDLAVGRRVGAHFEDAGSALIVDDLGGKIGQREEHRFSFRDNLAVGLALGHDLFPLGIRAEILPGFLRRFPALMR